MERTTMLDVMYVLGTIAFFVAMAAYGRACAALGKGEGDEEHHA